MLKRELPYINAYGTTDISTATSVDEALELAGMDWEVNSSKIYDETGKEIPGFKANIREDNGDTLGIVSNQYQIVQNSEALDFVNELPKEGDFQFDRAGVFRGGKSIWVMGTLPESNILGDDISNNVVFVNSHDGSSGVKVMMTPIRLICHNMINLATKRADRIWSAKHTSHIITKLDEARYTLQLANDYMKALNEEAEFLASKTITESEIEAIIDSMFNIDYKTAKPRKINNLILFKNNFFSCYNEDDIKKFKGSAWGAINAMADLIDHQDPKRLTKDYYNNHWNRLVNGHNILDTFHKAVRG